MAQEPSLATIRMWAFEITRHWTRSDGGTTTTADRVRWADEIVEWVTRPQAEPPTTYAPDVGKRAAA